MFIYRYIHIICVIRCVGPGTYEQHTCAFLGIQLVLGVGFLVFRVLGVPGVVRVPFLNSLVEDFANP